MSNIYEVLQSIPISYEEHKHPAVFTCDEADKYHIDIPGIRNKNLFLRNRNGKTHFLVVLSRDKQLDLKELQGILECTNLSFASPERLKKHLNLTPGSVTPLGLIYDPDKHIKLIIDSDLMEDEYVHFHPCINTATVSMKTEDFKRFLDWWGGAVGYEVL